MLARAACAALLSGLFLSPAASSQTYQLVPLGRADGRAAYAWGINDAGTIVGHINGGTGFDDWNHPARWENGNVTFLDTAFQYGGARAINDSGAVVGTLQLFDSTGLVSHATLWHNGERSFLEPPATLGHAVDVNDNGAVCGTYQVPVTWQTFPYRWSAEVLTTLPMPEGTTQINPAALNNHGDVVGFGVVSGVVTPLLWRGDSVAQLPFVGYSASATDINDSGVAVGSEGTLTAAGGYIGRAVRWDSSGMTYLGTLGGVHSRANGINSAGDIVGSAQTANGVTHAALWSGGTIVDLHAAAGDTGGCLVIEAVAINDEGQIAARIICPGEAPGENGIARLDPLMRSPEDRLARLIANLESAVADSGLAQSFRAKVDSALASLARGSSAAACNQLDALANAVSAQSGKALSAADAAAALAEIAGISEQLGC